MADMSMVVTLSGEGKSYAGTMDSASRSTSKLNADLDKLTAAMEAELAGEAAATTQKKILEAADKGASAAKVEYAMALANELDSHRQLAAAIAAEAAATKDNAAWIQKTIAAEQARSAANKESIHHSTMKEMATRGATEEEVDAYYTAVQATQKENQLTAALSKKTEATKKATTATSGHGNSATRNMMAIQALAFGVQDAAQVYGNTGLAGALSASANNIIFMTSMISPQLAILTAVGVAAGQFAAILLPMAFNTRKAADEAARLNTIWVSDIDVLLKRADAQRDFNRAMGDAKDRGSAEGLATNTAREGQDIDAELADRRRIVSDLAAKMRDAKEAEAAWHRERKLGWLATGAGAMTADGVAQYKNLQTLIKKQQDEIKELEARRAANAAAQPLAAQNAAAANAEQRIEESEAFRKKKQEEDRARETKWLEQKAAEEAKAHDQFVKSKADMERATTMQLLDDEQVKRMKIMDELAERQRSIYQWLEEGRISQQDAMGMDSRSQQAAFKSLQELDGKAKAKQATDAATAFEKQLQKDKKIFANQSDGGGGNELTAVEANSSSAFKAIFDATAGGGGGNPNAQVAENTAKMKEYMRLYLEAADRQLEATKKQTGLKTGPA